MRAGEVSSDGCAQGVREVVLGPGETLYLPTSIPHAVTNLEDNISITENYLAMEGVQELVHAILAGAATPRVTLAGQGRTLVWAWPGGRRGSGGPSTTPSWTGRGGGGRGRRWPGWRGSCWRGQASARRRWRGRRRGTRHSSTKCITCVPTQALCTSERPTRKKC